MRVYSPNLYTPKSWYENHSENFSRKGDSEGKLDFSVIFCPKSPELGPKTPILPPIRPKYTKINIAIQFYTILLCYIRNFIRIGQYRLFLHFYPGHTHRGRKVLKG